MSYKDILVHLNASSKRESRFDVAVDLAGKFDAHVTGLYVMTTPKIPHYIEAQIGDDILQTQRKIIRAEADKAEKMFRERMERAGVRHECHVAEGDPVESFNLFARYTDLVIISQFDPDDEQQTMDPNFPDRIILSTGRPVLVVPYVGVSGPIGANVLVAWDASRQAARAVGDAIPFLAGADKVSVLAVNPSNGGHGDIPGGDISLHLARHGIRAQAESITAQDMDPADILLSRASDEGADMIVMGAYGHRRLRELVLGGVTQHMLEHMTVPLFMSH